MRMKSIFSVRRYYVTRLTPPLGKSKNSYIILEIFNDFEGVTVLR